MAFLSQHSNQLIWVLAQLEQRTQQESNFFQFLDAVVTSVKQALKVEYSEVLEVLIEHQALQLRAGAGWKDHSTELFNPIEAASGVTPGSIDTNKAKSQKPSFRIQNEIGIEPGSQLEYILNSAEPVVVENLETETRFLPAQVFRDRKVISSVSVLVQNGSTPFGVLSVHSTVRRTFTPEEILFLQAVAYLLSASLKRQETEVAWKRVETATLAKQKLEQEFLALKQVEAGLRQNEERYALVANAINDGVWDWNLETNEVYFSPQWKAMLGYQEDGIGNQFKDWLTLLHPEDQDQFRQVVDHHCQGLTASFESQYRLLHQDGNYRWMLSRGSAIRDDSGKAYRLVGSQTDITVRKLGEEQLLHNALHDGLTGLANRSLFMERLNHAISLAKRHEDYKFAVVFLDLDRFKVINDSLGHVTGDQLLITIAHRLKGCLRASDTCARLGGDEFALLLEYVQEDHEAIKVVERIQYLLNTPLHLNGQEVFANASIGIILSAKGYEKPEDLIRDADTAMYRAKALGRGRYEIFTQEMHEHAVSLLQLETDLRRAIERQEFRVFYQPVMELRTNKITGFEALIRWQHPERGLVSPAEFVPIAEETGLILPIGRWVLYEACSQMKQWQQQYPSNPPLSISVNLSRKQFSQPDLVHQVERILQETGLEPGYLKLEITESAIMEDANSATEMMQQLKTLGIQLVMDDFGTGYSSLSHLHLFPIDTLKIDRSFVHKADTDLEKVEIIRTVISLAWNLGIDVVAEGIETKRQMSQLKLLKCDLAQGYLFSKPLSGNDATAFLGENSNILEAR
ncbi:EAL domain-containing protein [Kovacikia minuta CCNUW1]|uniref:EAL domain-containing protein n=1 Tax=Kovacikia minuta TaxID=2931930 RepID=UPI001CCDCC6E|nr:EAL domain-containing protein [Kovacikia minuta]UBF29234.1 EAL domain-containing protein [Kovacikia minuta CCNUW1]